MENKKLNYEIWKFAEKVQPVYELLEWKLSPDNNVPTTEDIVKMVEEKIADVIQKDITSAESGGIFAEKEENGDVTFGLKIYGYYFSP